MRNACTRQMSWSTVLAVVCFAVLMVGCARSGAILSTPTPPPTAPSIVPTIAPGALPTLAPGQPSAQPTQEQSGTSAQTPETSAQSSSTVAPGLPTEQPLPATETPSEVSATITPAEPADTSTPSPVIPVDTPTPVAQVPPSGCPNPYTVQPGEHIYQIARKCGVDAQTLITLNGLSDPDVLTPGQTLQLPAGGGAPPQSGTFYVVQAGDTLFRIAQRFGTTVAALQSANNLASPNSIFAGQRLIIP